MLGLLTGSMTKAPACPPPTPNRLITSILGQSLIKHPNSLRNAMGHATETKAQDMCLFLGEKDYLEASQNNPKEQESTFPAEGPLPEAPPGQFRFQYANRFLAAPGLRVSTLTLGDMGKARGCGLKWPGQADNRNKRSGM